ncbi:MAG TPA: hypothetical protein DDY37_07910 [Legionella sp.]|nr:hypothetical protein [Legionella sp.]
MGLQDLNVATLLKEQIRMYLGHGATYDDLRTKCLTITPIQPIVTPTVQRINDTAEQDKEQKRISLTQEAHASQVRQDTAEQAEDDTLRLRCRTKEEQLNKDVSFYNGQLTSERRNLNHHATALDGIKRELHRLKAERDQLTTRIQSQPYQHQHPNGVAGHAVEGIRAENHHEHRHTPNRVTERVERLRYDLEHLDQRHNQEVICVNQLKIEILNLERKISADQSELKTVARQLNSLEERKIARQQRSNNGTLSPENAQRLSLDIQAACMLIDRQCSVIKDETAARCHPAFLIQLANQLDGLALQPDEKIALQQLIAAMHQHMCDLTARQEQGTLLASYITTLQTQELQIATNGLRYRALQTEHAQLMHANDILGAELRITQGRQQTFEAQRNEYAQYALMTTIAAGLGAISGYFLIQTGVAVIAPIVPMIMAGVVGAALVTLFSIAGVARIRALMQQSEATTMQNTLSENTTRMGQITADLTNLDDAASQLVKSIPHYQRLINKQRLVVAAAKNTADASLAYAQTITVGTTPNLSNGSNPHSLFAVPSAPFAPGTDENRPRSLSSHSPH